MLVFFLSCNNNFGLDANYSNPPPDPSAAADLDGDGDGYTTDDCDDASAAVHPGAEEICDGLDNDCDGLVDEEDEVSDGTTWYTDADGDGFGDADAPEVLCEPATGFVDNALDCDDADPTEPVVVDAVAGSPAGPGTAEAPYDTIQQGISDATTCVAVLPGLYTEAIDFDGKDLHVFGVEGAEQTIIDASGLSAPAVTFAIAESSEAILEGFTVTGGAGELTREESSWACTSMYDCTDYYDIYCGGGVYISSADPTLRELIITGNTLPASSSSTNKIDSWYTFSYGGGVCVEQSTTSFDQVTIQGNYAAQGGGVYVGQEAIVELRRGLISQNNATDGGGVLVSAGGSLTMTNTALLENQAEESGGCMMIDSSASLTVINAVLSRCTAAEAGGVWIEPAGTLTMSNSVLYRIGSGGAIAGTTVSIFTGSYNNLYENTGGDFIGFTAPKDPTSLAADPLFVQPIVGGDWHLSEGSPSIDAGDPSTAMNDLDGTRNDQGMYGGPDSE